MKKSFKRLAAVTLTLTMALSLAACGPKKSSNVELRFNWWGGDERHSATLEAIKLFEEKNPGIKVTPEYEAWTGHEEKVALAINSNAAADVMQVNWGWPYDYSPNGDKFYDLNKVSSILNLANFEQASLDIFTINKSLQAVPISNTGRVFYWNEATFKKVGVALPTTLKELLEAGDTFAAFEDGSYYPMALNEFDRMLVLVYYLESVYGKNWVEDGKLQYSLEEVTEGLNFLKELDDRHVTPTLTAIRGDGADSLDKNQKWMDGKYAGIFEWDSSAGKFKGALGDGQSFVVGDFVKMGDYQGGFTKISMGYAISGSTKYPEESAKLIEFLLTDPEAVALLGDTRGIPANTAGFALLAPTLEGNIVAEANTKVSDWSKFTLDTKFESAALKNTDGLYFMVTQALSDGEDVAACAKNLVDGINAELNRK